MSVDRVSGDFRSNSFTPISDLMALIEKGKSSSEIQRESHALSPQMIWPNSKYFGISGLIQKERLPNLPGSTSSKSMSQ